MTIETKHTAGPWFAEEGDNDVRDRSGELIACAYGFFNTQDQVETTPITFANARLIAAAPDLLEAAWQAIEALNTGSDSDYVQMRIKAKHILAAAIAKAEGR